MFARLSRVAADLGYSVHVMPLHPYEGQTTGWPHFTVKLEQSLTAKQMLSTFCHELSHILLGHNARSYAAMVQRIQEKWGQEDPHEEAACELAAAAVMNAAGLSDGHLEADFIATKMAGRPIPQHVKDAANLSARILWSALTENQAARAAA
jgi:hypothetical protein